MQAQDIMARDVLTVMPSTQIEVALDLMLQRKVSGLPVLNQDGTLVGILTEGDLLRRTETGTGDRHRSRLLTFLIGPGKEADEFVHSNSRLVADLMTPSVLSVAETAPLDQVVALMEKKRIRRVPVVRDGKLVGIISRADLLRALAQKLAGETQVPTTDAGIEKALFDKLAGSSWSAASNVGVTVKEGVVTLNGFVYDERARAALRVAAENTPGVTGVVDQLVWIDLTTGMTVMG
ncbi:MAG: CBS domain-containing protein [Acetobacteraceae bacterium]|nr:CBS domain-containing protein [Acetobacteraceae bacterium]